VTAPVCITCGDVAVPMRVVRIDGDGLAECVTEDGQATSTVEVGLLDDVRTGDALLVHACVAIQRLEGAA
jgi:hydrogenase maturation factor